MCGIIILCGPNATDRLPRCLHRLRHRGPDDEGLWCGKDIGVGFARLAINGDHVAGHQPFEVGDMIVAVNGEIYNHRELCRTHNMLASDNDTSVFPQLYERFGPRLIHELDGFYSAVLYKSSTRELFCFRDHIGKKPLFVGRSGSEIFVTSELKAIEVIDWFKMIPRGTSCVNPDTGAVTLIEEHNQTNTKYDIATAIERAVCKRMPIASQPVGVFLSGGLDSSIVAACASRLRRDITYFTLGHDESSDRLAVDEVVSSLGLDDVRVVPLPDEAALPLLLRSVVYHTESFNPSVVSNGLATYLLAQAARAAGIKVVLTGEGADELFGGYHYFTEEESWQSVRQQLINDMQHTELRRLDMSCMAHGVEPRCPFLDRCVRTISDKLDYRQLYHNHENKVILRRTFEDTLPERILRRKKTSFDVGSGIRRQVVRYLSRNGRKERAELRDIWADLFAHDETEPFFHAYPVFDHLIDQRGEVHQ